MRSPGILDAVSNVVEFVKDEKTYRGRRSNIHSRYPKGTSSASTSPDLDRYIRERHRIGPVQQEFNGRSYPQRPRLYRKGTTSSSSSPCYTYDSYPKGRNQSSYESYEYDTNVLNGKSRSPSPSQRYGNGVLQSSNLSIKFFFLMIFTVHRRDYGANVPSLRSNYGRKLPPTPKQPSTLQIPFQSNINFPKLETSPSTVHTFQMKRI